MIENNKRRSSFRPPLIFLLSGSVLLLLVKSRVEGVEVFAVKSILGQAQAVCKALIVNDLARSEKAYDVFDVGVVNKPQNVVVGHPCLLLCGDAVRTTFKNSSVFRPDIHLFPEYACRRLYDL